MSQILQQLDCDIYLNPYKYYFLLSLSIQGKNLSSFVTLYKYIQDLTWPIMKQDRIETGLQAP